MDGDAIERAARARRGHPFLNTRQTSHYLGLSKRFLEKMRARGEGPIFRHHGRFVLYHIDDLDSWSRGSAGDKRRDD